MIQPGEQIDIWVVEKSLGAGGMGSVYRCHNRNAKRIKAAVKVLEVQGNHAAGAHDRFIREAEILFSLDHPNIVKVRNVRTDHVPPYLEMEFVEGEALEDKLQRGALPMTEAVDYMRQFADAMAYLHGLNVRHRDLKPANVLVRKDGRLKVVDFGLAMEADVSRITQAGVTFGTVSYAPPEWVSPDNLDPAKWDLYAMGVCFWEMLTGRVAFPVSGQGSARQQAMQVILSKQNHPPLDPGDEFHPDLRDIIQQLTRANPAERPADAATVAATLHGLPIEHVRAPIDSFLAIEGHTAASAPTIAAASDTQVTTAPRTQENTYMMEERATNEDGQAAARPSEQPTQIESFPPRPITLSDRPAASGTGAGAGAAIGVMATLLAVIAGAGVIIGGYVGWKVMSGGEATRAVEVAVAGPTGNTAFDLRLGDLAPSKRDGWLFRFDSAPTGKVNLRWAVGAGCAADLCPGDRCPEWCGAGQDVHIIDEGAEAKVIALSVSAPEPRTLRLLAPKASGNAPVRYRVSAAGEAVGTATAISETLGEIALVPGEYALIAEIGACPSEATDCSSRGACPPGCASQQQALIVPWGRGGLAVDTQIVDPAAISTPSNTNPANAANPGNPKGTNGAGGTTDPAKDPVTPKDPPKDPVGSGKGTAATPLEGTADAQGAPSAAKTPVTRAEYGAWLTKNADWTRDAALEAERADGNYLADWKGGNPPVGGEGQAMVNVSWYAASAFCRSRGGLADVAAEPHTWADGPFLEWRTEGSKPAWRSNDGATSTKVQLKSSNAMTGFRCAR